jgi:PAS domain S-box-containing protein
MSYPGWNACRIPESNAIRMINDMEIRGIWSGVIKEERSLIVNNPASHPSRVGTPKGHPPLTSFLGVPLKLSGRTIGMIALANKESGYDLANQEAVEALSVAFVEALHRKRAEINLRDSEEYLQSLLNSVHVGIITIDAGTHTILDANPFACTMIGSPKDQIVGSVCHGHICPAERGKCPITDLKQTLDLSECVLIKTNGERIPVLKSVVPTMREGRSCLLESFTDITAQKQKETALRESEERFRAMTESTSDAIVAADSQGKIIFWNSGAKNIFGYEEGEILGRPVQVLLPEHTRDADKKGMEEFLKTGASPFIGSVSESICRKKDGSKFPAGISRFSWKISDQSFIGSIIRDITERKQKEEESRTILRTAMDGFWLTDTQGNFLEVNDAYCNLTGYSKDELLSMNIRDLEELETQEETARRILKIVQVGRDRFETRHKCKDGRIIDVEISVNCLETDGGRLFVFIRDITQHKQAEEAFRESEERFRSIVETTNDAIISADSSGKIIFWNKAAENIYGYSSEEAVGKPITIIIPETIQSSHEETYHRVAATGKSDFTGQTMESRSKRKDGSEFPAEISISFWVAGDNTFITALIRDITERKQAEEALRESEERLRSIVETAKDGVVNINSEGNIIFWNKSAEEMFGYSFDEIMGKPVTFLMPPRFFENYESRMDEVVSVEQSEILRRKAEVVGLRKDGTEFPVEHSIACWETKEGIFYTTILRDVTEHKQADAALRESEERFRSIMENANDAIFFVDSRGNIHFFNRKAEELYGYTADEIVGRPHSVLVPKRLQEIHNNWMEKFLLLDEPAISGKIVEGIGERKDGSEFYVETSTALLKQEGETYLVAILRDITERKHAEEEKAKLESQLRQSQKMEAVGLLSGGIAHDFNNILTAIIGYASLIQMKMKGDDPLKPYLEQILTSSQRATNLTQSLLAFGRKQIINPRPVQANEIITRMEKLLVRLIGEDIDLKTTLSDEDTTVMADSGQIEQVLMNFATNARDAMPQGGHFIIETQRAVIDDDYVKTHGYGKPGKHVLISVSDSGTGMDEKTREKIFEPFFTTKEVGKGTGLGLAMVYGIVKQHNGYINCYSEPGKGTTFKIYLSAHREAAEVQDTMESAAAPIGGTETILVAEDDADVRKTTRSILENFGYTVLEAEDGEDAIRVFQGNRDTVKLLLLDVIMPKKNGKETYEEIRKLRPGMKALFISGYTANIIHKRGMLDKTLDFIMKPVSPTDLLRKVREVIEKK